MRLPIKDENDVTTIDMEHLNKMVDTFLERGFTYFDTAYVYHMGKSEIALRESLVKDIKREFYCSYKTSINGFKEKEEQETIFNEQLEKCGVDYFDYYLLHNIGVSHYEVAKNLIALSLLKKRKRRKNKEYWFFFS